MWNGCWHIHKRGQGGKRRFYPLFTVITYPPTLIFLKGIMEGQQEKCRKRTDFPKAISVPGYLGFGVNLTAHVSGLGA